MAIHDYKADRAFEDRTRRLHYPFLLDAFEGEDPVTIEEVTDATPEGKAEQLRGIDAHLIAGDGGMLTVELKTDRHVTSPNVFLEDVSNSATGTRGCTLKCQADILSYGFCLASDKELRRQYLLEMHDLKEWYVANRERYPLKVIPNPGYETRGRPVPIKDIENFIFEYKIVIEKTKKTGIMT